MPKRTANTAYRKKRAALLRDKPNCHWCKHRPATEADHVVPWDLVGDDTEMVPACKPCNSRRGAEYQAQKRQKKRTPAQNLKLNETRVRPTQNTKPLQHNANLFFTAPTLPPRPGLRVSQKTRTGSGKAKPKSDEIGLSRPRLETIMPAKFVSSGAEVAAWAKTHLGVTLMPWQLHVARAMLGHRKGTWLNRIGLVSVARQNGKTILLRAILGWYITVYAPKQNRPLLVITTAHKLDLAVALFQDVAPLLKEKFGATVKYAYGRNQLVLGNCTWVVRAATPAAGHGLSADLLLVDEVWGVSQEALDIGLLPTQRAKPNPLCVMFSTAGTEDSHAMLRWREQGLRAIDTNLDAGMYLAEYSPPPNVDPMTIEAWRYANPALGHTITEQTLHVEAAAPNRAAFLRSSVNLWVQSDTGWIQPGVWANNAVADKPAPGGVLAVEVSLDDGRYCAVRVNKSEPGTVIATVEFVVDTMAEAWRRIEAAAVDTKLVIAVTPTLDLHCPLALQRRRVIWGYQEVTRYTAAVRQMIIEGKLQHTGETMLAEHVGRAVAGRTHGTISLSSQRSPGPIELARCLVAACGLVIHGKQTLGRPAFVTVPAYVAS